MFNIKRSLLTTSVQIYLNFRKLSTIYALSSGFGKCGVAVIRVSGPKSGEALKIMSKLKDLPKPRTALLKHIVHPTNNEVLDRGLILWFPGPNSFTGEDCCEFQVHGGKAVISAVLQALQSIPQFKPAEPGEFTKRAFQNGKMDLTEVEGIADLLQAETEMQRKQALLQTEGSLKTIYNNWRSILIRMVADVEAYIDFEESELLGNNLYTKTFIKVNEIHKEIESHLADGRKGEMLRNGIKTVIVGEPNVGKSSLMNILSKKPTSIVSPCEGTTRDLLQATLDINGYPIILLDTAGLRKSTSDLIEKEGIRRAVDSIQTADLLIFVFDINTFIKNNKNVNFSQFFHEYISNLGLSTDLLKQKHLIIANKSDLIHENTKDSLENLKDISNLILLSCTAGRGLDKFIHELTSNLKYLCGNPNKENPVMNQERHRYLLNKCVNYLEMFISNVESENVDVVIMAQYLKLALRQFSKLTGNVATEDVLNVIFKEFCIGK